MKSSVCIMCSTYIYTAVYTQGSDWSSCWATCSCSVSRSWNMRVFGKQCHNVWVDAPNGTVRVGRWWKQLDSSSDHFSYFDNLQRLKAILLLLSVLRVMPLLSEHWFSALTSNISEVIMTVTLNHSLIGRRTRFHMFWQQGMSSPSHPQLSGQAKGIPPSLKIN